MTGLEIAALIAMIAGAGIQYKASTEADERQRNEISRSIAAQRELQLQAEKKATDTAKTYEAPKRIAEQEQIATDIEKSLINPVSESQAIRQSQQTTQGEVSGDYKAAKAASDIETMKQAEQLARLLGKSTSAGRLRLNEGVRMMDTGQAIDQIGSFSRGRAGADNIAIQQAGKIDPTKIFIGQILQAAGSAGLGAGGSDLSSNGAAAQYGSGYGSQQSAMLASQEAGMGSGGLWNTYGGARSGWKNFAKAFK